MSSSPPPQLSKSEPELYYTTPTPHCPNSPLPVLVYRNVFSPASSDNLTPDSISQAFSQNSWLYGGTFKHFPTAHFHSNTHECYAAIKGSTRCLYGVGPLDEEGSGKGVTFEMKAGDIAVHAAGVAHRNVESSEDYEYVGLYPRGAPRWDNNYCKDGAEETAGKARRAEGVPIPECDPVFGREGPLVRIWRGVLGKGEGGV